MALSPLDEFLQTLNAGAQGFAQGGQALEQQSQLQGRDELMAALESGQALGQEELAGKMLAAGDSAGVRELLGQKMKAGQAKPRLNMNQIKTLGGGYISDAQAQAIADIEDAGLQREYLTAQTSGARNDRQFGLQMKAEGRREEGTVQEQRNKFESGMKAYKKAFQAKDLSFKNVKSALEAGTVPADNIIFNFVARDVAGEKGPLSNDDIARIMQGSAAGDIQAVQNYFFGEVKPKLTDEQRKAMRGIVEFAVDNYDKFKDDVLMAELDTARGTYPKLFQGDKPDKAVELAAKNFGYKYTPSDLGLEVVKDLGVRKERVNDANPNQVKLPAWIDQISNPAIKQKTIDGILAGKDPATAEANLKKGGYLK